MVARRALFVPVARSHHPESGRPQGSPPCIPSTPPLQDNTPYILSILLLLYVIDAAILGGQHFSDSVHDLCGGVVDILAPHFLAL